MIRIANITGRIGVKVIFKRGFILYITYYDVYIGYLDDSDFKWEGGDWSGNCPKKQSPFFPSNPQKSIYHEIIELSEGDKFEGKQVDWGGWVIKMTKKTN